jgi:phosphatidylglycerophosphate synthase
MSNLIWVAAGVAAAKKRNGSSSGGGGGGDDDVLFLILLLIMIAPMVLIFSIVLWPVITLVITILFIQFIREAVKEAKGLSQDEKSKLKKRCIVRAIGYVVTLLLNIPWWIWALPNL